MICRKCNYRYEVFDENGLIDYCPKRDIYCDEMEGIIDCNDLSPLKTIPSKNLETIMEMCRWKEVLGRSKKTEGIGLTKNHDDCYTCKGFDKGCKHYTILDKGGK